MVAPWGGTRIARGETGTGGRACRRLAAILLASGAGFAVPAQAQDDDALYWAQRLRSITVTATRAPIATADAPATVTVITAEDIADQMATDIKDLVRFEPGVTVPRSPARFGAALGSTGRAGNEGFVIRGIGGNRTQILVDGVRVPDGFSFGAQSAGRGDYVDLGLVKSVEILRGPASALYGSDGLSGAVSFTLSEPGDFLTDGQAVGGLLRGAYSSDDNEFTETAIVAGRNGALSAMVAYTRRDFEELKNKGTVEGTGSLRTAPNPQDGRSNAVLGRIVWDPADSGHKLRLTGEYTNTYLFTDVLSGLGNNGMGTIVDRLEGEDTGERKRIAADWSWQGQGTIEYAQVGAYWQDAEDRQFTAEDRTPAVDRTRINTFENRVYGASAELRAAFSTGDISHRLVTGGDISFTRQRGLRDGTVPTPPDFFPSRAFPETDFTLGGVFIGDEIAIADGMFTLFPALRFDAYKLDPADDPLFPGSETAGQSDHRFSPKIGAVAKLNDAVRLFANYATGFKAPEPSQMNQFFENLAFGYTSLPNPDLGPERSESWEGGIRYNQGGLSASATAFKSNYKDFISQEVVGGSFTPADPALYQFVNIGKVKVEGLEGRIDYAMRNGITGRFAVAYAKGDEVHPDGGRLRLGSIDPLNLVAGLGYRDPQGRFGGEVIVTHNARKSLGRTTGVDEEGDPTTVCSGAECYRPGAFTIVDATVFLRLAEAITLRAGVFNITDEKHTYWNDVRGLSAASQVTDAYTRPGRNASASVSIRF